MNDGTREISDAREPQKGKREIGATAMWAAFWGETSGVTPQNQDEDRNNEVQGPCCGLTGATTPTASPGEESVGATDGGTGAMHPMMPPWAGRRWRQRGRRFPGKHRSREKLSENNRERRTARATTRPPLSAITVPEFWEACLCLPTRECIQTAASAFPATCARA